MLDTRSTRGLAVLSAAASRPPVGSLEAATPRRMPRRVRWLALVATVAVTGCADSDPLSPDAATDARAAAAGAANAATSVTRDAVVVPFTLSGAQCGLASDVSGVATIQMVNHAMQTASGEWRVWFDWAAHGTATGGGVEYRFNYAANGKWLDVTSPPSVPVVIELADHFNLIGPGQTPDLRMFLHGRFLWDGTDIAPVGDPVVRGADVECDPI